MIEERVQEPRQDFINYLAATYKGKKAEWHNMNHTLSTTAIKISVLEKTLLSELITEIDTWNKSNPHLKAINLVATAGWDDDETAPIMDVIEPVEKPKKRWFSFSGCFSREADAKVEQIYHDSFSLNPYVTTGSQEGCQADFIVHFPPEYQRKELQIIISEEDGQTYLQIPAGARFSDIDQYLLSKGKGYALAPTTPTVQYVTAVGAAATGSYGPSRVEAPISTSIVKMTVINPQGKIMTLSEDENREIFLRVRDAHLGAGFIVLDIVIKGIEKAYKLKRTDIMLPYADVSKMMFEKDKNPLSQDHFVGHYFPAPHSKSHCFRYTTFERTDEDITPSIVPQNVSTVLSDLETDLGEPLIEYITKHEDLHKLFTPILEAAMLKTFGFDKEKVLVQPSAQAYHLLKTYTHSRFTDHNFLIPVDDAESGREILMKLLDWWHLRLQAIFEQKGIVPVLTIYMRHTKGIYDPKAETGIAPTVVSKEGQTVLSFEPLTYEGFAHEEYYQELLRDFKAYMVDEGLTYREHPGKTPTTASLEDGFTDELSKARLEGFRNVIKELHGKGGIERSALMTPGKREYIFGKKRAEDQAIVEQFEAVVKKTDLDPKTHKAALKRIIELAGRHKVTPIKREAQQALRNVRRGIMV